MRYRRYGGWDYFPRFPKSRPRAAKGGIKAQSKRGGFGQSWWAKRWISVLESFDIGARLGRGRSYARNGQVLAIDVQKGKVTAKVQGSRPQPYAVTIEVKVLSPGEWEQVIQALSAQALFVAKLLAGEMPQDVEQVFEKAKVSLFPQKKADLKTDCSCPDWSNPCKHVAAVYYLLGEEFDRDPFLLFRLRGLGRDELLQRLGRLTPAAVTAAATAEAPAEASGEPAAPLPADPSAFWTGGSLPDDVFGEVQAPPVSAAWLQRLGNFPFWRGESHLRDVLEPIYEEASQRGVNTFLGGKTDPQPRE
ncbi:MAG TPA: SWIM zinc finger family protein [Gemmataceae bacterium]|nr:SWIM zinc finger family protein [Gemmataceae bacterium]